jgi:hypothetical protein
MNYDFTYAYATLTSAMEVHLSRVRARDENDAEFDNSLRAIESIAHAMLVLRDKEKAT